MAGETALGYLPHSSEIAGSVVFFASDLSKPVTGPEPRRELRPLDGAVIKLTVLVKRNPALSVEEFHEEWRAHGRMIADEPVFARYIRRYEQHHRVPADYRNGDTFDGMVLQWFDSLRRLPRPAPDPRVRRQDAARRDPHPRPAAAWSILFTEEAEVFMP